MYPIVNIIYRISLSSNSFRLPSYLPAGGEPLSMPRSYPIVGARRAKGELLMRSAGEAAGPGQRLHANGPLALKDWWWATVRGKAIAKALEVHGFQRMLLSWWTSPSTPP